MNRTLLSIIILLVHIISIDAFISNTVMLQKKFTHSLQNQVPNLKYYKISRPENIPFDFSLPIIGKYITSNNINPSILLLGFLTVLIESNRVLLNDYNSCLDFTKEKKISNKTSLKSHEILHLSYIINIICSSIICYFVNDNIVRINLSNAMVFSYAYTHVFKKILFFKNISVAFFITQSLTIGGLYSKTQVYSILPAMIYIFNVIIWQELQLDNLDIYHDRKNKLHTVPVLYGSRNTNILSLVFLIAGTFLPFGTKSHIFIILQFPLIFRTIYAIKKNTILDKSAIQLCRTTMIISEIFMCLLQ